MSVVHHPLVTEKAMNEMDFDNKLQFIVDLDAAKPEIVEEIESRYEVSIEKVNTQVTPKGTKKATVRLSEDDDAQEVASRIGVF
ncbi:50S ribosomal protein L23 [Halogeometricum borinquense]|uniref:Large ribosomal subunit protein uL23 n=2 Tax=Halogeometricum borinquense TaxID=60847 RepID=E4NQ55_HALBP|nr:50S ribosomal protein L23 [Halogeometricum borinquense]ADQ66617.1 LSU ribosomal protein L23P [Halogeometricum borinquense DSM 11551]ELY30724.1 50S ribosomal protein L23P [Halogeometricum borinquense DSM 11551]QIB75066.1 50S ribosomal protein L23 [Halogeometricum borinquense]QIQ75953.1 50S ribosomal protein L23 [Halogeometricum borinquense]RYJ14465.1 50S ribosomal protein L23 [Halogeometricum borinquense]